MYIFIYKCLNSIWSNHVLYWMLLNSKSDFIFLQKIQKKQIYRKRILKNIYE